MGPQLRKNVHVSERESKFYFVIRLKCVMGKIYDLYLFKTSRFMPRNQQFVVKRQRKDLFCVKTAVRTTGCPTKNTSSTDTGKGGMW